MPGRGRGRTAAGRTPRPQGVWGSPPNRAPRAREPADGQEANPGGLRGGTPLGPVPYPWGVRGVPPRPVVSAGADKLGGCSPPMPAGGYPPALGGRGVPRGAPPGHRGAPRDPPGAHFFGYLITLPVGTKMGHFLGRNFGTKSRGTAFAVGYGGGTTQGHIGLGRCTTARGAPSPPYTLPPWGVLSHPTVHI